MGVFEDYLKVEKSFVNMERLGVVIINRIGVKAVERVLGQWHSAHTTSLTPNLPLECFILDTRKLICCYGESYSHHPLINSVLKTTHVQELNPTCRLYQGFL